MRFSSGADIPVADDDQVLPKGMEQLQRVGQIEIHAGFDKIRATAVVRSVSGKGCGIEFVHMSQEDREKLRRRINKLLD